ncbi:hypothetical protein SAMN04487968_105183 [Nocardioides terrae]|uniref:Uncharacterized protein n=1 Tax=Nocardioides terrae TaxID=574651 RepID=A0A1I1I8L4_9ACTN|nr:hypothetical protein [Nocardioides terrae]SFC32504.1 hypothetical protein SAMN04487968_105183 [Nocardioides terrae]
MAERDAMPAAEWEPALDRLELQVSRAEQLGVTDADLDLRLPAALSTIPRYLLDRAQSLVERHQRLVGERSGQARHDERPIDTRTLHDRVGHLTTGARSPVSPDFLEALQVELPAD